MKLAEKVLSMFIAEKISPDNQIKIIKKKGSILPLKKPIKWKSDTFRQIETNGIEKSGGKVKLIGTHFDTEWFSSIEDIANLIDWNEYEKRKNF